MSSAMRPENCRIEAIMSHASEVAVLASQSFTSLRNRWIHVSVRSTIVLRQQQILLRHRDV
jgi:hypothetical protein